MMITPLLAFASALAAATPSTAPKHATDLKVQNPGFEAPAGEQSIPGWNQLQHAGVAAYEMNLDGKVLHSGKHSFRMERTAPQVYGLLSQPVPAPGVGGKIVEISAWMKTEDVGPEGWIISVNFVSALGEQLTQENSKPLTGTSKQWQLVTVRATAPKNAGTVDVGLMLLDKGTAWADDVRVRVIEP